MSNKTYFSFFLYLCYLTSGCGNEQKKTAKEASIKEIRHDINALHHSSMKKLDDLIEKKILMKNILDSLSSIKSLDTTRIKLNLELINSANTRMSNWMSHYKFDGKFPSLREEKKYYTQQLQIVKSIDLTINQAIATKP